MNRRTVPFLLLICLPLLCRAQLPASTRFDNLGIDAGLSQSTVYNILQDYLGYIWICTEDGVNQYDGYHFRVYRNEPGNAKSIPNSEVLTAYEDHRHNLWFVTGNGISRFNRNDGNFERVLFQPGLMKYSGPIFMTEIGEESFFIDGGLLFRMNAQTQKVSYEPMKIDGLQLHTIGTMPDHTLLISEGKKLFSFNPASKAIVTIPFDAVADWNFTNTAAICMPGRQFIFLGNDQLLFYDAATRQVRKHISFAHEYFSPRPRTAFDAHGYLWFTASSGIFCVDTSSLQYRIFTNRTADPTSLAGNLVRCIFKDRNDILWIGTNEGGTSRLAPNKIRFSGMGVQHDGIPGLSSKAVLGFAEDHDHNIWMATDAACIDVYDPATQTISKYDKTNGCPFHTSNYLISLYLDDSFAWCGHDNGIDKLSLKTHQLVAAPLLHPSLNIKQIIRCRNGDLLAGGSDGLFRYNSHSGVFEPYGIGTVVHSVDGLIEDRSGSIWIGMYGGLLKFNPATKTVVNYTSKYPDLIGASTSIGAFSVDQDGVVWMGTSERGILRYNQQVDSFTTFTTKAGLPNNMVYATIPDDQHNIWVTTNYGISRFNPTTGRFTSFTVKDGLQSNEFNGRAIFKDHSGRLYFGNVAGFNSIDPAHINFNTTPPHPQITAFRVFDQEINFREALANKGRIELAQSQNYFSIEYAALDFTNPSENKYRIMLEGFDKDWRPLSSVHTVSYTNLDAGHYTFKIKAYNNDDVAAAQVLELPIYVKPPFYKTWWFIAGVLLSIIGILFYLVWLRLQTIRHENEARLQLSDLNRQMTEYKLQALQAQMNPHFIFNSMNAIQSIIMQNDPLKAAAYLADFSKLMRRILDNSHDQFVSLETIVETLKIYVHLEAFRFNNEFIYEFRIDEDADIKNLKLPPMLLQPYVENAILHGLMPKEGDKKLLIHLFEKKRSLHCIIEDNGVGRSKTERTKDHISRGELLTKGMRDSLNHLLNITATINYTDLTDRNGQPAGTRVEIIIPLP